MEDRNRFKTSNDARAWVESAFTRDLGTKLSADRSEESEVQISKMLDDRFSETVGANTDDPKENSVNEEGEISSDDRRSASEIARSICARNVIPRALMILEEIMPLQEASMAEFSVSNSVNDNSGAIKSQIKNTLQSLLEEVTSSADSDVIESICDSFFKSPHLLEQLASDTNLRPQNVITREDERSLINFIALCAYIRSICYFPAVEHLESITGQQLGQLGHNFRCMPHIATEVQEELAIGGLPADCGPVTVPGVKSTDAMKFHSFIRRMETDPVRWMNEVDLHGKRGALGVHGQVDRVATEIVNYQNFDKKTDTNTRTKILLQQLYAEIKQASDVLARLLEGRIEETDYGSGSTSGGESK